jgi:hypothetical protein
LGGRLGAGEARLDGGARRRRTERAERGHPAQEGAPAAAVAAGLVRCGIRLAAVGVAFVLVLMVVLIASIVVSTHDPFSAG